MLNKIFNIKNAYKILACKLDFINKILTFKMRNRTFFTQKETSRTQQIIHKFLEINHILHKMTKKNYNKKSQTIQKLH